jgi:hypothetical protein
LLAPIIRISFQNHVVSIYQLGGPLTDVTVDPVRFPSS